MQAGTNLIVEIWCWYCLSPACTDQVPACCVHEKRLHPEHYFTYGSVRMAFVMGEFMT